MGADGALDQLVDDEKDVASAKRWVTTSS